ncbi:hypothetical protein E6P78_27905 [Streptomyces sp. A0958]|uniref:hypothetical protein n=1 Tax=Streptomyces sp. A0958 TaxID=2563101 RepID=UPI00109E914D|nr:hypothetical protein [Streptomyces sp. A0958]THA60167.1 hypothetical protein E6P78_27905 [Streptomyces sp. A0958]
MASIPELYTREMHTKYQYLACWLPSTPMAPGDVGVLSGHTFRKLTTLAELGIPFTRNPDSPFANLNYSSTDCVAVAPGVRVGPTADDALCTLSVTFTRDGATLFQASDCVQETLGNLPALEAALRARHENRAWRLEYVVVTEVVRTGPTAILVAEHRGAQLDLQVSASALTNPLPVASAAANCVITRRHGIAADVLVPDGATPLFRAVQLRKRPLRPYDLVFRSDDDDFSVTEDVDEPDEPEETDMVRVTWADLGRGDATAPMDV